MDYFRAVALSGEKSQRVLDLTSFIISHNPAHYTVWKCRQDVLQELKSDLHQELEWVTELVESQPKSYQIWHHRQVIMERLNDTSTEKAFLNDMLQDDSKNYHLWTYRQWLLTHFGGALWDDELSDVNVLIDQDVRNNSAWMHRYFVLVNRPGGFGESLDDEIQYVMTKIKLAPRNESPWNYARGIISHNSKSLDEITPVYDLAKSYINSKIPQALLYLLDVYELQLETGDKSALNSAQETLNFLIEHDPIRAKYWSYRHAELEKLQHS
ncbi:hypothetical protein SmJEL517_g03327 [Synchytrium microbalum]|uniref:Protein farnesyltransferase/geranylgeranyltransferase type-1 subunit alpha n=1 Tax=Synchytrium microbalum TaxID=1806994 RepID=A0A507C287_9FUNG|nr:uncharacterized protein SmJEL517_g03327 [Synchytrium microbalum]TPX33832.1 hypothetical protein SmJEL517_g03327 [Synchytrium microbalum]